jgi:hypothetical protein
MLSSMSDVPQTPAQRRDALLLKLLKTPPQPRDGKPAPSRRKSASRKAKKRA